MKRTATAASILFVGAGFLITLLTFFVIALGLTNFSTRVDARFIEKYLSRQIQRPVQIASINTQWAGLRADVDAMDIEIMRQHENLPALRIRELKISIDPLTLLSEQLGLKKLSVSGLAIQVRRHLDGRIQVGDLETGQNVYPSPALEWLLSQPNIEISQAQVTWIDDREPERSLTFDDILIEVRNDAEGMRFVGRSALSRGAQQPVRINGEIRGQPLRSGLWDGRIQFNVEKLNLGELPLIVTRLFPWQTTGAVTTEIETEWLDGHIIEAEGQLDLEHIHIPFEKGSKIIPVERFTSSVSWEHDLKNWRLAFGDPRLSINGHSIESSQLVVGRTNQTRTYYTSSLVLEQVVDVIEQFQFDLPWQEIVTLVEPRGRFGDVSVIARGPFLAPDYWRVETRFEDIAWKPVRGLPGVSAADGKLIVEPDGGQLQLEGENINLDWPDELQNPLDFNGYKGLLRWSRNNREWKVDIDDISLSHHDLPQLEGRATVRFAVDGSRSPHLDARFRASELDVERLKQSLPRKSMSPKLVKWLDEALVRGRLKDATLDFRGHVKDFPFRNGEGSFFLSSAIEGASLQYAKRWPEIDEIYGTLRFNNAAMYGEVDSGVFQNSHIKAATVQSRDIFSFDRELNIHASVVSPAQDVLEFLTEGPLIKNKSRIGFSAVGNGALGLDIFLPLRDLKRGVKVQGRYSVNNVELSLTDELKIEDLNGDIEFSESTVSAQNLSGSLLGSEVSFDIETVEAARPPVWRVNAEGKFEAVRLAELAKAAVLEDRISGNGRWSGHLLVDSGVAKLEINSDLEGVEIKLPEPLTKVPDDSRPSSLWVTFERGMHTYEFDSGALNGALHYAKAETGFTLKSGGLALGKTHLNDESDGVRIDVKTPYLNADEWIAALSLEKDQVPDKDQKGGLGGALRGLSIDTEELRFLSRDLGSTKMRADSVNGRDWTAWVSGDAVNGQITASMNGRGQPSDYVMKFEYLNLPRPVRQNIDPQPAVARIYPNVEITADHFIFGDWDLGRLDLNATSYVGRWRLDKLALEQPGLNIDGNGHWAFGEGGSTTQIKAKLTTDDIAIALKQLNLSPHMADASAEVDLVLEWDGDPQSFELDKLNGTYTASAESGRFLNLEPGSGKLLGLFNIEALSRRFSLDFSDIFSKGLTFDQINGRGDISSGNLYSDELFVVAPLALIQITGRTGLKAEDYDLKVVVAPRLGSQISMLSALANPVAGAVVFLAYQVFSKQLSQMIQYEYKITGSWETPDIISVRKEPGPTDEDTSNR